MFDEAARRDPAQARTWIALVDGANHQIDRISAEATTRAVEVHILCDFIHVIEYLWKAAWCFHHAGDPTAEAWVHDKARAILAGRATAVAGAIRRTATNRRLTGAARKGADDAARYLTNKAPYLDYHTALAGGWPIATDVIEGACRHLVADRLDITGARWGLSGAEAVLQLRALRSNRDFDDYWAFHQVQELQRVHTSRDADNLISLAASSSLQRSRTRFHIDADQTTSTLDGDKIGARPSARYPTGLRRAHGRDGSSAPPRRMGIRRR